MKSETMRGNFNNIQKENNKTMKIRANKIVIVYRKP